MYVYPGFILYRASKTAFSIINYHDAKLIGARVGFHEREEVPVDSKTIGQTWAKTNKDGSRDKRFADNFQIPIVQYGELTLKSETGLWEKFLFSNPEPLERFIKSWNDFVTSFDSRISVSFSQEQSTMPGSNPEGGQFPKLVGTDVHFECKSCHQPIEVNAEAAGQEFRCPGCGEKIVVPEVS